MVKTIWNNLSKPQRVGVIVFLQVIMIVVLILLLNSFLVDRQHVEIESQSLSGTNMPSNVKKFVEDNLWAMISKHVTGANRNDIDDAVVREGTYEENVYDDGSVGVKFIVDIDSLKQTYTVSTGWEKNRRDMLETIIDCPLVSQMKYPEAVCYGAYHNTYSLDLYLPYRIAAKHNSDVWDVLIDGNEYKRKIYVDIVDCNPEKLKKQAIEYLDSIPIDLSGYEIIYEIHDIQFPYINDNMSESEIGNLKASCQSD